VATATREAPPKLAKFKARRRGILIGFALTAGGLASVAQGTDANWDLRNYHLFGAFAFLHGLTFHHLAAAQMQSFFNPLPQLPAYALLASLNGFPRLFAFLMGLPAGLCGLLLFRIAALHAVQAGLAGASARAAAGLAVLIGVTGAAFVPAIGTSSGDVLVAAPLLLAYLQVLRATIARDEGRETAAATLALAGFLAGLAAGAKLTMAIYAAPLGIMIALALGARAAVAAALGMGVGFALAWGPFAFVLWRETGNPFFPMFNDAFRSHDFLPLRLADERFLPRSTLQAWTYPFWWVTRNSGLVSELRMRDPRIALGYLAGLVLLLAGLRGLRSGAQRIGRSEWLLLGVAASSLALWCRLFGVYRYLVVLEMLAPLLPLVALARLRPAWVLPGLGLLAVLCLATTVRPDWGHRRIGAELLWIDPMPVGPGDLVLLAGGAPQAYLVPFMPRSARAVGIGNNLIRPEQEHGLQRRIRAAIAAHRGTAWVVTEAGTFDAERDAALRPYGLVATDECGTVRTSFLLSGHRFCTVRALD
jgi:hypothetical protein